MFVNARSRVYHIPENKKKLKVGAEAEKQKSSSASGNRPINVFFKANISNVYLLVYVLMFELLNTVCVFQR